jgi:hypothetical protein
MLQPEPARRQSAAGCPRIAVGGGLTAYGSLPYNYFCRLEETLAFLEVGCRRATTGDEEKLNELAKSPQKALSSSGNRLPYASIFGPIWKVLEPRIWNIWTERAKIPYLERPADERSCAPPLYPGPITVGFLAEGLLRLCRRCSEWPLKPRAGLRSILFVASRSPVYSPG